MKSIALTLMLCVGVTAQVWYPFSPNPSRLGQSVWLDDTAATPIDEPHRITIRDGHFATSSGERVRFLAATITGAACYPDTNSAKAMAQWIRRIGYNAVVLRLWDYTGTGGQYPLLWRFGTRRSTEPFDSSQFDRLLYLMAELRRNGLYIALTTDGFIPLPDDGVARTDSLQFPWNVRYVQYIDSTYRALHRSVLERLLTAHNPYTGLRVGDDPALALLLLPDNNSLFAWWRSSALKALLPSAHQQMLHAQWNAFLRSRYTSTVQLQQAWRSIPRSSTDRITDGSFEDVFAQSWFLASANGAQAVLDYSDADKISGQRSARIRIAPNAAGANVWDVFLYQTGATLEPHKVHVLRFWAKTTAPAGKTIQVSILRNGYPWESLGLTQQVRLTPSWQRTELRFIATDSVPALVAFAVGGSNGDVFLDSIFLAPQLTDGLHAEESLEQASVILLHPDSTPTPERLRDAALFLTQLETSYYASMYRFIRGRLGLRILVGGGTDFSSANDLVAIDTLDFTTATVGNGGISSGPNGEWYASTDASLDAAWGSTIYLASLAARKQKPLFIASYTVPYPCPFINEIATYAGCYCLYQDWDGIAVFNTFTSLHFPWDRIQENNFWSAEAVYALHALIPPLSTAFRSAAIEPSTERVHINLSRDLLEHPYLQRSAYFLPSPTDSRIPFLRSVRIDSLDAQSPSFMPQLIIPDFNRDGGLDMSAVVTEGAQLRWNQPAGQLSINTPRLLGFQGRMGSFFQTYRDGITIEHLGTASMASLLWASLDARPISASQRSFLALTTRTQNEGAKWTGTNSLWQGWGNGSTQVEATAVAISIASDYDSLAVIPLGDDGLPMTDYTVPIQRIRGGFRFILDQRQIPTAWFVVTQYRLLHASEQTDACELAVSPHPLTADGGYALLPEDWRGGTLELWDTHGRCIIQQRVNASKRAVPLSFAGTNAGTYLLIARSGGRTWSQKVLVLP
jgi:hypothetical protein